MEAGLKERFPNVLKFLKIYDGKLSYIFFYSRTRKTTTTKEGKRRGRETMDHPVELHNYHTWMDLIYLKRPIILRVETRPVLC